MDFSTAMRRLRRSIASLSVVAIVASLSIASSVSAFSDVPASAWYYGAVQELVDAGVVDGSATNFNPGSNLVRAEAAKAVVLAAGVDEEDLVTPETPSFKDVPKSAWYYKYVETAKSLGFVSGDAGKGTFRPGDNVNRAEFAKMMVLALELEENTEGAPHFSDVASGAWYYSVVETAFHWSVVDGYTGGVFKPAAAINRAEMAKMVVGAMDPTEREPGEMPGEEPSTPAPAGSVSVALAGGSPSGSIIASQAAARLADFTFKNNGSSELKVNSLLFKRSGPSADSTLSAVYLYEGTSRLTDSATVSDSKISFNSSEGLFVLKAGETKTVSVVSNILAGTSGQEISIVLEAATSVGAGTATVAGSFPVSGSVLRVASATLATVDFNTTTTPSAASVDPQTDYVVWQNTVSVQTRYVWLKTLTFREIGSIDYKDLKNFRLYVDGNVVGTTIADLDSNGYVKFDVSGAPYKLETGNRIVKVVADVVGGSNRNFKFSLRQAADAIVTDSEYGANVLVTANGSAFSSRESGQQDVNAGTLTVTKKTESPTGNVVRAATGVTLGTFELKAAGEKIKVENLRVAVDDSGDATDFTLRNGTLYADGKQIGSTASIASITDDDLAYTEFNLGSSLVVEPGKPVKLEVKADIFDNDGTNEATAGVTLKARIVVGSSNAQRLVSASYFNAPGASVDANVLAIVEGTLALTKDQSYGNQSAVVPQTAYLLSKYALNAGTNEDVNLNTIQVDLAFADEFAVGDLANVYVKYGDKTTSLKATVAASNSWSINQVLPKNTSIAVEVYGDIASGAVVTETLADTVIPSVKISGTTVSSATSVNTNSNAVLAGQTITAVLAGNLTVIVDPTTPVATQVVAGSTPADGSLKLKLTGTREDLYVKDLTFRVDTDANDAVVSSAALFAAVGSGAYAQVGPAKTLVADGTNPGYVQWTLSGADRIKVPKDGSTFLIVKPTYVGSSQVSVTGQNPKFVVTDLQAEGTNTISASGTGANATNASGIVVKSVTSGTAAYLTSTETTAANALANGVTGTMVGSTTGIYLTTANGIAFATGDVLFIDENADATWDPASEELFTVVTDLGTNLVVKRGVFGTTATTHTAGKTIYRLDNASSVRGLAGNAMTVLKTRPTFAIATDSPAGATTGGSQKVIFKFNATAANNAEDPAENKVVLTSVDITNNKSGLTVTNAKLYPSEFDQNATYATTCIGLSQTKWRCTLSTAGSTNEIVENSTRTYVLRADVGSGAGTSNSLDVSIATLSTDVVWTDGTTSVTGVVQPGATYVQASTAQTMGASSGITDATAPTITAIAITDAAHNNLLEAGDTIALTFSEMIDPTTISSTLVPGGAAVAVTDGATGDISLADAGAADTIVLTNIITLSVGNDTWVEAGGAPDNTGSTTAALNSAGTILTLTIVDGVGENLEAGAAQTVVAGSGGTTVKDVNGTAMTAAGSNGATVTSDAI